MYIRPHPEHGQHCYSETQTNILFDYNEDQKTTKKSQNNNLTNVDVVGFKDVLHDCGCMWSILLC